LKNGTAGGKAEEDKEQKEKEEKKEVPLNSVEAELAKELAAAATVKFQRGGKAVAAGAAGLWKITKQFAQEAKRDYEESQEVKRRLALAEQEANGQYPGLSSEGEGGSQPPPPWEKKIK